MDHHFYTSDDIATRAVHPRTLSNRTRLRRIGLVCSLSWLGLLTGVFGCGGTIGGVNRPDASWTTNNEAGTNDGAGADGNDLETTVIQGQA